MSRIQYQKLKNQKVALLCVQRAIRNYLVGKQWLWWQIWLGVKPGLKCYHFAEIKDKLDAKRKEAESKISNEKNARKAAESINQKLEEERYQKLQYEVEHLTTRLHKVNKYFLMKL